MFLHVTFSLVLCIFITVTISSWQLSKTDKTTSTAKKCVRIDFYPQLNLFPLPRVCYILQHNLINFTTCKSNFQLRKLAYITLLILSKFTMKITRDLIRNIFSHAVQIKLLNLVIDQTGRSYVIILVLYCSISRVEIDTRKHYVQQINKKQNKL